MSKDDPIDWSQECDDNDQRPADLQREGNLRVRYDVAHVSHLQHGSDQECHKLPLDRADLFLHDLLGKQFELTEEIHDCDEVDDEKDN